MKQSLVTETLIQENRIFKDTGGVSDGNHSQGFLPAFRDTATGQAYVSRFADGRSAPVHLLDGLPDELVIKRTALGKVLAVKGSVESGFLRNARFYTRTEAALAA